MTYRLIDISPAFKQRVDDLREHIRAESLYKDYLGSVLDGFQNELNYTDELLNALLEAQRLMIIHDAGLALDEDFFDFYKSYEVKPWQKQHSPPVERELIQSLADKIYNMRPGKDDFGMLHIGDHVRSVAEIIFIRLINEHEKFDVLFADPLFKAHLLNAATPDKVRHMSNIMASHWNPVNRRMVVASGTSHDDDIPEIDKEKERIFKEEMNPVHDKIMAGKIHYTLTVLPSEREAKVDGIPYEDYLKLFFEMCDQPWDVIDQAQRFLIKKLDAAKTLRFTNNDGTDVEMSIEGMTFANSLIARNVPGSEVFSAPIKESVNGKIVAKGIFTTKSASKDIIKNMTFIIKNGKVVEYDADEGLEALREEIEMDKGSCYFGEVAIGTNPHLKQHIANGFLVEKIGGSFHMALGDAYTATEYMGAPVKFDNGNRSLIHWDITTMLYGKEGKIYLDGDLIMDHGFFLDEELDVLNRGWEAIAREERPDYWKDYDFKNKIH